jgi:cytochrome P450
MIPLNLDPADHAAYRAALMRHFDRKFVASMEDKLRSWSGRLIDRVVADGRADFTESLGAAFPVSVFMELMGMSLDRFDEFRAIVNEYFSKTTVERRIEIQNQIIAIMTAQIEERRVEQKDDLLARLVGETVRGQPLTLAELQSIGFILFLGGMDTVANALTFAFQHLAGDPELQRRLVADPSRIPDFVEESLRCYGVVNQTRIVKKDVEIAGARFREGDMVLCVLTLAGRDERKNADPDRFDIDRKNREHIVFSTGAHTCIGNILARAEMRIFTEEWVKRIPEFRHAPGVKLEWRPGLVMSLPHLPLEW